MTTTDVPWILFFLFLAAIGILTGTLQTIRVHRRKQAFVEQHRCKAATSTSLRFPLLFGLDFVIENTYNITTHQFTLGLRRRFEKYGVTHTSHVFHRKVFNTIDPHNLETIMKTSFEDYTIIPARRELIQVLFGKGIFASGGDDWRHSRALVRAAGLRSAFDVDRFEKHAQVMLTELKSRRGQPIEFRELIFHYTFNLAADILLDLPSDELDKQRQFARDFTFLGKMARFLTIFVNQIPFLAELSYGRDFQSAQRRVFDQVDQRIEASLRWRKTGTMAPPGSASTIESNTGVIEGFLSLSSDTVRIRSELLNLLLPAHDSVGIALSEMFYCLARSADSWAKLRDEVEQTLQGQLPTLADLKGMEYLQWTIKESKFIPKIKLGSTSKAKGVRSYSDSAYSLSTWKSGYPRYGTSARRWCLWRGPALRAEGLVRGLQQLCALPESGSFRSRRRHLSSGAVGGSHSCHL